MVLAVLCCYCWRLGWLLFIIIIGSSSFAASKTTCGDQQIDVIVIGAGLAGLTASLRLAKAGKCVLILEADDVVGGKCRNWDLGTVYDHTDPAAPAVATNVQVSVGGSFYNPLMETTFASLLSETGLMSSAYPPASININKFPPLAYPRSLQSENPIDFSIFVTAYTIGVSYPVLSVASKAIQALQSISVEDWLLSFSNATATAKDMVRDFVMLQMSVDATLQDAYSFCKYVSEVLIYDSDTGIFPNGPLPPLIFQLVGGTGQLVVALHRRLEALGVVFKLRTTAVGVDQSSNPVKVLARGDENKGGEVLLFTAREYVIVTGGPGQIKEMTFTPKLPGPVENLILAEQVHQTVDVQLFAFFKHPWWFFPPSIRSPVIVPSQQLLRMLRSNPDKAPKIMGVTIAVPPIIATEPSAHGYGVLRIMVPGDLYRSSEATIRADVLAYLAYFNINVHHSQLMDVKIFQWSKLKRFVNHGYFPTSSLLDNERSSYLQVNGGQVGKILFAGTESASRFTNLMEGAALSGYFAANKVLGSVF